MDLNDFWQENKKWILSCVAGLIVFLIAKSVVHSSYVLPVLAKYRSARADYSKIKAEDRYLDKHLKDAKTDREALRSRLATLRDALHFELADRFDLNGKGDAELHLATVYAGVRGGVFKKTDDEDVEFLEKAFTWSPETEPDKIQRRLIGVSLVEHVVTQLLSAHRTVTKDDYSAMGLRSILDFKMDRTQRSSRRRSGRRDRGVQAVDLVSEVSVAFKFEADNATIHHFLENCRVARPRVTLGAFKVVPGRRPGDPLLVTGDIRALSVKPLPSEEAGT